MLQNEEKWYENLLSLSKIIKHKTSKVLLAGVLGGFSLGPCYRPTYRLARLDMSEKA